MLQENKTSETVVLGDKGVSLRDVYNVAMGAKVELSTSALKKMTDSHNLLVKLMESGDTVYGLSTGVGDLAKEKISAELSSSIQRNIIYSHSAGIGSRYPVEIVRAAMFTRAATLAMGYSGVRPELVNFILDLLNKQITPCVPCYGSVGASGDLIPLAHIALTIIGDGNVLYHDRILPAIVVLKSELMEPMVLQGREGLALINGPQFLSAIGTIATIKLENLISAAVTTTAMTMEITGSSVEPFDKQLNSLKAFPGQNKVAEAIREILENSKLVNQKRNVRIQDGYSIRCAPQIYGALWDVVQDLRRTVEQELCSVSDNPIISIDSNRAISGGNFHGEQLALWLDFAALACAEVTNLSERHLNRMLNPALSGLPAYLAEDPGPESGLMLLQYLAADFASENKVLAHPSSVDNVSLSSDQEDHVSFGATAGRKLLAAIENAENALSAEILAVSKGYIFVNIEGASKAGKYVTDKLKRTLERIAHDGFPLYNAVEDARKLIKPLAEMSKLS